MINPATTNGKSRTHAHVTRRNGKVYDLGRIDRKRWTPRAWFYRFVVFKYDRLMEKF